MLSNIGHLEASRRLIADKNREMESDLAMACEVQLAMLPQTTAPLTSGNRMLRLAHRYQPAGGVSGDFFDALRISEHTIGLLVCDVMGHGVRSALIHEWPPPGAGDFIVSYEQKVGPSPFAVKKHAPPDGPVAGCLRFSRVSKSKVMETKTASWNF